MKLTDTQIKLKIEKYVLYWIPILGLENWDIGLDYNETVHTATASAKPEYLQIAINFNMARIKEFAYLDTLEKLVLHELCHALTWQLANWRDDGQENLKYVSYLEELTTTSIENAIWRASGRKIGAR